MKEYLLALLLLFFVGVSAVDATPKKHRHQKHSVNVTLVADSAKAGINAFSDTTSTHAADSINIADSANTVHVTYTSGYDFDELNNISFKHFLKKLISQGVGGFLIVCLGMLVALFAVISPFVALIAIIYLLIRRHKDKVKLTEKAIEMGRAIPENVLPMTNTDEVIWRKGVKNTALGIGLALMFYMLTGVANLSGIGVLIMFYGLGQMYMAKNARKHREDDKEDNNKPEF